MRYKKHFKNPDAFLKMVNKVVPFLNGGLFECLDDKTQNIYIDGFSDQMTKGEYLVVPDYLFFGATENVDLSSDYGVKNRQAKQAAVKGLINILKSYKFTITENTPIEEDVALDPELLGKVFENLLASYNPETKTTARKQTGSFYTPREIVNYMVDESLIAYLKNAVKDWNLPEEELDKKLHQLSSFDNINPFTESSEISKKIVYALDRAKILDPAAGSGAFPMGVLQKMVHILQKLDPTNELWKEVQLDKALDETKDAYDIEDKKEREQKLIEINNAFDEQVNDPDFARKLYLIENCIYGVDIQPIATQISKLRFFISLVVDQKVQAKESNFGIRPLPNLETKFVTANTLIGIEKENSLFYTDEVKSLENELKKTRHKLFSARTKETKLKYRQKDKELRNKIADVLKEQGLPLDDAEKLAKWDPYDQNASSPFFDPEWMFDIKEGFDVVIANPPYKIVSPEDAISPKLKLLYVSSKGGKLNLYKIFIEKGVYLLNSSGTLCYINPNTYLTGKENYSLRKFILEETKIIEIIEYTENDKVFENVTQAVTILRLNRDITLESKVHIRTEKQGHCIVTQESFSLMESLVLIPPNEVILAILKHNSYFKQFYDGAKGEVNLGIKKKFFGFEKLLNTVPMIRGRQVGMYDIKSYPDEYCLISADSKRRYKLDRVIFPEISNQYLKNRLRAFISNGKYICSDTTNYMYPKNDYSIYNLVVVLNSKIAEFFFNYYNTTNHIPIGEIKEVPIPESAVKSSILDTLGQLLNYKFSKSIDSTAFAVLAEYYFPDHMQEREIDVLVFVEQDINEVMQDREFEALYEAEKEQIIEHLRQKWTDPDNEVRNRIKLFAVRSPEILKPILES